MKSIAKAAAAVRELCRIGLPQEVLVPALLEALHDVVPSSRNLFDWTDHRGQLVRYYFEGPVDVTIAQLYFAEFHNRREAEAMPAFAALTSQPGGIRSAAELDRPTFFATALYHEIWRPQGLRYRVEAVVRGARGRLLGSLVLYRGAGDRCFTRDEERRLLPLLPDIAAGLEAAPAAAAADERWSPSPEPPETVVIDSRGRVLHATAGAARLILLAERGITPTALLQSPGWTGSALLALTAQRLRDAIPGGDGCRVVHDNASGRFLLDARWLNTIGAASPPLAIVRIARHERHRVAVERALRELQLTPGQHQVCRELIAGHGHAAIAAALGIGTASVADQVSKIYRVLGVRSPIELRARFEARLIG